MSVHSRGLFALLIVLLGLFGGLHHHKGQTSPPCAPFTRACK